MFAEPAWRVCSARVFHHGRACICRPEAACRAHRASGALDAAAWVRASHFGAKGSELAPGDQLQWPLYHAQGVCSLGQYLLLHIAKAGTAGCRRTGWAHVLWSLAWSRGPWLQAVLQQRRQRHRLQRVTAAAALAVQSLPWSRGGWLQAVQQQRQWHHTLQRVTASCCFGCAGVRSRTSKEL